MLFIKITYVLLLIDIKLNLTVLLFLVINFRKRICTCLNILNALVDKNKVNKVIQNNQLNYMNIFILLNTKLKC